MAMRALMYGVEPEVQPIGETDNRLLRMLARTPTRLIDIDEPGFLRPDWVVTRPRLVGICGSESKAVFLDYASLIDPANASGMQQNPMKNFVSMPSRDGPRGDRRGGRRRPRGGGARAGGPCRPQPVAHLRDPRGVARLPGVRGG